MKCDNCGFIPNPGDTICMKCGARLSSKNAIVPGLEKIEETYKKSNNTKLIVGIILGIVLLALIVFVVIKFLILKR